MCHPRRCPAARRTRAQLTPPPGRSAATTTDRQTGDCPQAAYRTSEIALTLAPGVPGRRWRQLFPFTAMMRPRIIGQGFTGDILGSQELVHRCTSGADVDHEMIGRAWWQLGLPVIDQEVRTSTSTSSNMMAMANITTCMALLVPRRRRPASASRQILPARMPRRRPPRSSVRASARPSTTP